MSVTDKLITALEQISRGTSNHIDESYLDKLLTFIIAEIDSQRIRASHLQASASQWHEILKSSMIASFYIQLYGHVSRREEDFLLVKDVFSPSLGKHADSGIRRSFFKSIVPLMVHKAGLDYLREEKIWKISVQAAISDPSMYVRREAKDFVRHFLRAEKNDEFGAEVLKEILLPIGTSERPGTEGECTPRLKLIDALLEDCIEESQANNLPNLLINDFKLDKCMTCWAEIVSENSFLDSIVTTFAMIVLTALPEENQGEIPVIFAMYRILIKEKRSNAILTLSRVCQKIWLRLRCRREMANPQIEMHFFIMQIMFAICFRIQKGRDSSLMDQYVNKLRDRLSEDTFRMCYPVRDLIRSQHPEECAIIATRAVHGFMEYHKLLNRDNIVILFQSLAWALKNFAPTTCETDVDPDNSEVIEARKLCETANPLLNAVLQALCTLVEEYHIVWSEAFEGLCMLKLCHWLLQTPLPSVKTVVLTLRLTRLCIQQCMPPSLVLLLDGIEGTSLEAVGPLLTKKLHDIHWEIRDSALEVIAVIADLALVKYPVFQDLILNQQYCQLAVTLIKDDAEGYVRASACNAVISMVPCEKLWRDCLAEACVLDLARRTMRNDTEGIVRRKAALLITALLHHRRIPCEDMNDTRQLMLNVVFNDLHWETRVNALSFWREIIDIELQEEGMVDEVFPAVTFSKSSKKIVTLTQTEVQSCLLRVLERLSSFGCLNVLKTALLEDSDEEVTVAASEVIKKLLDLLRMYQLIPLNSTNSCRKRKCSPDRKPCQSCPTKSSTAELVSANDSDSVIESIINTRDINLLAGVLADDSESFGPPGKQTMQIISPEDFLACVQDVVVDESTAASDLTKLLDDFFAMNIGGENIPDCY